MSFQSFPPRFGLLELKSKTLGLNVFPDTKFLFSFCYFLSHKMSINYLLIFLQNTTHAKYTQQNQWQYLNDFNRHEDNRNTNKKPHDNLTLYKEMLLAFYEALMP